MPVSSLGSTSIFLNLAQAFLTANADTKTMITNSLPNMYVSSASGAPLLAKLADYGIFPYLGAQATIQQYQFTVPSPVVNVPLLIPALTAMSTVGDNILTIPVYYQTTAQATIPVGQTVSNAVPAQALLAGTNGNVNPGTLTVLNTNANNGSLTGTNLDAGVGGVNPDTIATLRDKGFSVLAPKYSVTAIQNAILGVTGVEDAYVFDPQDNSGHVFYYWCDANNAQPASLAVTVAATVSGVVAPNITAISSVFTFITFTSVNVTYSAPTAVQETTLQPQVQQGVVTSINSLSHNQAPASFQIGKVASTLSGGVIVDFQVTGASPPFGGPSNTIIYRITGTSAVNTTRIYL